MKLYEFEVELFSENIGITCYEHVHVRVNDFNEAVDKFYEDYGTAYEKSFFNYDVKNVRLIANNF